MTRLSSRIVALFLGLLLLVQALGFAAISASIERNARSTLAAELKVGENIWNRLLEQKAGSLLQGAELLAADFGFRSAVVGGDIETLDSALENHAARINADVSAWLDAGLNVRAVNALADDAIASGSVGADELRRIAGALARSGRRTEVAVIASRPFQFVAVPVKAPLTVGWVVMGFPIDQALVDDMKKLSSLDVAVVEAVAGGQWAVGVSTLGAAAADLAGASAERADIDGDERMLRRVALAGDSAAGVLLLRSVAEAVAPYRQLQWWLLAVTLVGVAVFAVGSVITARRVTTPLRSLVHASERLGRGDYGQPMQHLQRADEIGDLARAFDHMRVNIAANQAEIRQLAYWDRLTGLPNRAQFRAAVQTAIDARSARGRQLSGVVAVVMLDLDRFKHVNDLLGYTFGDRLLQAVAERIQGQIVREGDLVARLSGDKFALLLPGADALQALAVARRIAGVFEQPLQLADQTVDVRAGFGIACWPDHAADADALLSRAEVAMYGAKRKTEAMVVYDATIDAGSVETLSLLSELRRALEHDELRLFLQPKIGFADGRMRGVEALVRWQHPSRGMVPPLHFIPFAEQTGFVRELTLWMFDACAREWSALAALGVKHLSINLSTRDLMDSELPAKLDRILARHGVPATAFCLEITESAIMDEPKRAKATLDALSGAGFRLSIDDYGTGYSSLEYVAGLPVNELKIDKSFVMSMERVPKHAVIVRSTIELAHNLGLSVVAEGVENAAVWELLRGLDCDEGQGYYMSRPLPAGEIAAFAERWAAQARRTREAATGSAATPA